MRFQTIQLDSLPTRQPVKVGAGTRERLIEAAGEIFARHGFRNATVRDICRAAGANIAAVNYHFRDKEGLYAEVLLFAQSCASERYEGSRDLSLPADERLALFIRAFFAKLFDQGRPAWHGQLMAREMVDPSPALDRVVETSIRPTWVHLTATVAELLGPAATQGAVRDTASSILGQCLVYVHCRPVIDRLYPGEAYAPDRVRSIADHVVAFSLGAIAAAAAPARRPRDSRPARKAAPARRKAPA